MENKSSLLNLNAVVSVRGGVPSASDGPRTIAVGRAHRQLCKRRARMAVRSRVLPMAFSLVLGSVPIAIAQTNQDHPTAIQFASGGCGPGGDSTNRCVSVGVFTNQHLALGSCPTARSDPDSGPGNSMSASQERGVTELNQPGLASRAYLANPALTASPHGWRIGGAGVLGFTARDQRWRFVFGYAPDLGALREDFGHSHSFNLVWQYSFGKHKPSSWAGVTTGSEYLRRSGQNAR